MQRVERATDELRDQIEQLNARDQQHVFSLLLEDTVPFTRTQQSVMMCLSRASPACIQRIRDYIRDLRVAAEKDALMRASMAQGARQAPITGSDKDFRHPAVHFEDGAEGTSSDDDEIERRINFNKTQKAIRRRIRALQRSSGRARKSSSKKDSAIRGNGPGDLNDEEASTGDGDAVVEADDAGEHVEYGLCGTDDDAEDVEEGADDEAGDDDGADDGGDDAADDAAGSVDIDDSCYMEDDTMDDEYAGSSSFLDATVTTARNINLGGHPLETCFAHYVDILSREGFDFGDPASAGYPALRVRHDQRSLEEQTVR
jgi:hypothetical protein